MEFFYFIFFNQSNDINFGYLSLLLYSFFKIIPSLQGLFSNYVSLKSSLHSLNTIYEFLKKSDYKKDVKVNNLNIDDYFEKILFNDLDFSFDDKIIFNKSEDYGPGTKLLGSLNQIKDCQYIILLDDDHVYKKNMLEIFATKTDLKSDNAYSFCTYSIEDLVIGQGADGFMIRTDLLKNIKEFFL